MRFDNSATQNPYTQQTPTSPSRTGGLEEWSKNRFRFDMLIIAKLKEQSYQQLEESSSKYNPFQCIFTSWLQKCKNGKQDPHPLCPRSSWWAHYLHKKKLHFLLKSPNSPQKYKMVELNQMQQFGAGTNLLWGFLTENTKRAESSDGKTIFHPSQLQDTSMGHFSIPQRSARQQQDNPKQPAPMSACRVGRSWPGGDTVVIIHSAWTSSLLVPWHDGDLTSADPCFSCPKPREALVWDWVSWVEQADFTHKNRVRSPESNQGTEQNPPPLVTGFPQHFLVSISYIPSVSHRQRLQNPSQCYPWPGPTGPPKHSGVSNNMIPKSALGKSGTPHSQQTEHDSEQLWCPAELLLHPQGPGLPIGMAECKGWHQGSTGGVQYTSVLNYSLFPHQEQKLSSSCLQWHAQCSPADPV